MIFAVSDVLLAVNMCINYSFFTFIIIIIIIIFIIIIIHTYILSYYQQQQSLIVSRAAKSILQLSNKPIISIIIAFCAHKYFVIPCI